MQAAALLTLYSAREQRAQAAAEEARALAPKVGAARSGDAPTPCSRATPATPCPPPAAGPFRPPCPRGGFSAATEGGGALRVSVRSESRRHGQQAGAGLEAGRGAVSLWRSVPVSHGVRATPGKLPASVYLPVKWAFWEDIWGCCGD